MKILIKQFKLLQAVIRNIMLLMMVMIIGYLAISPSFAEHGENQGRGGNRGEHGGWRGEGHHGNRNQYRGGYQYGGSYGYGYAQPVYTPPPMYYAVPPQSPGINLILPLNFR